jgi:hypothetical protein
MTTTMKTTRDETFFRQAVERYIDEDKPDTLRRRQIESWRFAWWDDAAAADPAVIAASPTTTTKATDTAASTDAALLFVPDHCITGTLTWTGEYVTIRFHCTSYWKEEPPDDGKKNGTKNEPPRPKDDGDSGGSFVAKCHVNQVTLRDDLSKEQIKVQQKLAKRWKKDATVTALLNTTGAAAVAVELFDVSIVVAPHGHDNNEQRSYWNENCCAALRTIFYTTAESSLEVFEFIVRYLPTVIMPHHPQTTSGSSSSQATTTTITKLADRAVLRLLEDATYDACAAEDSDTAEESLEELHLDHPNDNDDDDDDDDDDNKKKKAKRRKRG